MHEASISHFYLSLSHVTWKLISSISKGLKTSPSPLGQMDENRGVIPSNHLCLNHLLSLFFSLWHFASVCCFTCCLLMVRWALLTLKNPNAWLTLIDVQGQHIRDWSTLVFSKRAFFSPHMHVSHNIPIHRISFYWSDSLWHSTSSM